MSGLGICGGFGVGSGMGRCGRFDICSLRLGIPGQIVVGSGFGCVTAGCLGLILFEGQEVHMKGKTYGV